MKNCINGKVFSIFIILLLPSVIFGYNETSQELTPRQLRNLTAFSKLYGYLRFFNPTDAAHKADWDWYTIEGIKSIENSADDEALINNLEQWGQRLAPLMTINKPTTKPRQSTNKVRYRWHKGYDSEGISLYKSCSMKINAGQLAKKDYSIPSPDSIFSFALADGITVYMPVSVYVKAGNSLPKENLKLKPSGKQTYTPDNRSTRLAVVIVAWNILKHFYPYWDVVKVDWEQTLNKTLSKASTDKHAYEGFNTTLSMLISDAHDGHGDLYYWGKAARAEYNLIKYGRLPVKLQWVEGKVVISDCTNCDSLKINTGDIITSINGIEIDKVVASEESKQSAATDNARKRLAMMMVVPKDSIYTLEMIDSSGNNYRRAVSPVDWFSWNPKHPAVLTEIRKGIYYVDLTKISSNLLKKAIKNELKTANGIVFDVRGYPRVSEKFLKHLTKEPLMSARWMVPIRTTPESVAAYDTSGRWHLKPQDPFLKGKIVFLTDERAISYAESVMGIVEHYKLGQIVGRPTAGTNGNIDKVRVFDGFNMIFTGMKVLKHDGSQHHGVGIFPTIRCDPTIEGIRHGKDEQLEKAISVIEQMK